MRKVIRKKIRKTGEALNVVGDVNVVVASDTGRRGEHSGASARQRVRIVQRDGHSMVTEQHDEEL